MTALPLFWGEGDAGDILQGRVGRSPALHRLDQDFDVVAIDEASPETLRADALVLAQPRLLAPSEMVAIDKWIRAGGKAVIFADPRLDWPSRYPLGDPRRPPPVTLLDPLFAHWRVVLEDGAQGSGRWRVSSNCQFVQPEIADCRVGKGRAVLVADADLLYGESADFDRSSAWLAATLADLTGEAGSRPNWTPLIIGLGALAAAFAVEWQREQKRKVASSP